jgi:hypothetical protein
MVGRRWAAYACGSIPSTCNAPHRELAGGAWHAHAKLADATGMKGNGSGSGVERTVTGWKRRSSGILLLGSVFRRSLAPMHWNSPRTETGFRMLAGRGLCGAYPDGRVHLVNHLHTPSAGRDLRQAVDEQ